MLEMSVCVPRWSLAFSSVSDLQTFVAASADAAGAHSTAPALLLQLQDGLGQLGRVANEAIDGGRRPFKIPHEWDHLIGRVGFLLYRLADQTDADLDATVRAFSEDMARAGEERLRVERESSTDWT